VATDNLAAGVATGVMLSGVFFTFKVARLLDVRIDDGAADGTRRYVVTGQIFFASADVFVDAFDTRETENRPVRIDVTQAHFWDVTAVAALDKVVQRLQKHGSTVEVIGLNSASAVLVDRLGAQK
jgi:SulP family sulfate permease